MIGKPTLTHGSLFSGIGGFELAASWAGIPTLWSCELMPYNRAVLKKNFPDTIQNEDVTKLSYPKSVDIISGGFPCQDISCANQKQEFEKGISGTRSGLWKEYARIIYEIRPSYVIFENSPMLLKRGFEVVLSDLQRIGYDCEWRCFYATQYGFNHLRKRVYGVAYPHRKRLNSDFAKGGILHGIVPERQTRQAYVPMPSQRFNRHSDFTSVRMDDGFPRGLDKNPRIHGLGNAVVPQIPYQIFKAIKEIEYAA